MVAVLNELSQKYIIYTLMLTLLSHFLHYFRLLFHLIVVHYT